MSTTPRFIRKKPQSQIDGNGNPGQSTQQEGTPQQHYQAPQSRESLLYRKMMNQDLPTDAYLKSNEERQGSRSVSPIAFEGKTHGISYEDQKASLLNLLKQEIIQKQETQSQMEGKKKELRDQDFSSSSVGFDTQGRQGTDKQSNYSVPK